jgi:hypothetical protein
MDEVEWVELGREVVLDILKQEHAVTRRELEARGSDRAWAPEFKPINPHIFTVALRELQDEGIVDVLSGRTRGLVGEVATYHYANPSSMTRVEQAAARKRLRTARHHGWTTATKRFPRGLAGPAGEEAVTSTLITLDGYSHVERDVEHVLGSKVTGGSLDNVAYLVVESSGRPRTYTCLVEVKNRRPWFYADHPELHRFLYKAAQVQATNPHEPVLPVFICRRRQNTTFELARLLGFYAIEYGSQLIKPAAGVATHEKLLDVAVTLGYQDLRLSTAPTNRLLAALGRTLPRDANEVAGRWQQCGPAFIDDYKTLMRDQNTASRQQRLQQLRAAAEALVGAPAPLQRPSAPRYGS